MHVLCYHHDRRMMHSRFIRRQRPGFLLLEVLIGIAVFSLFVSAVGYTLLYGQENTIMSGDRIRATQFSERALEATRSIRDGSYSSVTTGPHGVWIHKTTKKWAFTGSSITQSGGYITSVTVTPAATGWLRLSAQTKWKHGYNRSGSVVLTSEITDWGATRNTGNWSTITVEGTYTDGGTPVFNDVAIYSGSYLFLTSGATNGLHVISIATPATPTRINSSFSMGVAGYDAAVRNSVLYVATASSTQEIRAYNITSPSTFSSAQLIASYNLPGSGRARALAIKGNMLYVGTTASAVGGEDEFYAFQLSATGGITLRDTLNDDSSSVEMIALSGTAAYLASSLDTSELRVIDVETATGILLAGGYNLSDRTSDSTAIAVSGTSALLGSVKGASIQEMVLFDLELGGLPTPPPGPWYHEGSGSVVGLDMDPTRCYGFISALSGRKAFQVFNLQNKSTLAEITTYNSTTGLGRGLLYDVSKDRVYLITDRSLIIFRPATATGTCP